MSDQVTVWITEPGRPLTTHQGSRRYVCVAAEKMLRDAVQAGRLKLHVHMPSSTLPDDRQRVLGYIAGVMEELSLKELQPSPEIGWKPKVQ